MMIDFKKKHIKKAGYCLFLAATCGVLGENIHLPELSAAWAIGGIALEGFFHTLRDLFIVKGAHKISEGLPSKLNEDLERAIKSAYEKSIDDLITDTIEKCDLNEPFLRRVNNYIRNNVSEIVEAKRKLRDSFFDPLLNSLIDEEEISKMLEQHQQLQPDEYIKKIISNKSLAFYYVDGASDQKEFVEFVSKRFAGHFLKYFKTELKNDERARTVYFANVEEAILSNTDVIKGHTTIIKEDTADIRSKVNTLQADINLLLDNSKLDSKQKYSEIKDPTITNEIQEIIIEAQIAKRLGKYEEAKELWDKIAKLAAIENNQKLLIRVQLEIVEIQVTEDTYDLNSALKVANECLEESKKINLGSQVGRVLQLLGEIHRLSNNTDQARGFLNASLEFAKSINNKNLEGWAYLALGMLSMLNKESFEVQFDFTKRAYDSFTNLLISGEKDSTQQANAGYAFCHEIRAIFYGYKRSEEALTEYSRAISIYRQMDYTWQFHLGKVLLERGEMKAMKGELILGVQDIVDATVIFTNLGDKYMEAKCTMACGEILDKQGHRIEAEKYFRSAVQTVDTTKNEKKKSWFYFRYAMKLLELGEHDEARELLLMLLTSVTSDSQKIDILKTLCDLSKMTKNNEDLKLYEEQSLLIIEKLIAEAKTPKEKLRLLFNQGNTLLGLDKNELALETFERAINLAISIPSKDKLPDIWSSIAAVHNKMKNSKAERETYEKILAFYGDDESSPHLVTSLMMIAQIEMKLGNFEEARRILHRSELLCKKMMPFMLYVINDIKKRIDDADSKAK